MNTQSQNLVGSLALMLAAGVAGPALAMTFGVNDIVSNQIKFSYNANEDKSYVNGTTINKTFAAGVDSATNVGVSSSAILVNWNYGWTGSKQNFVYSFNLPTGYTLSSLSVYSYLMTGPNAPAWDYLRMYVSTDNANWTAYASLITPASYGGTGWYDNSTTYNLTSSVTGGTKFYIKGVFDCVQALPNTYLSNMSIFKAGAAGDANSGFKVTMGVAPIPEPATLSLLVLAAVGVLGGRRRRPAKA